VNLFFMHISHVGRVPVHIDVRIDFRDLNATDRRVTHVHTVKIARARVKTRHQEFAGTERHPTHGQPATNHESVSAKPRHHGRREDRRPAQRSGQPSPAASRENPSAVMKRSVTPGGIVNPGPAPGGNPCPVPCAVRSPVIRDTSRHPHVAVALYLAPNPVVVQIFHSGYIGRYIFQRRGMLETQIAIRTPFVELVGCGCLVFDVLRRVGGRELHSLARAHRARLAIGSRLAFAAPYDHESRVALLGDVNAIISRP